MLVLLGQLRILCGDLPVVLGQALRAFAAARALFPWDEVLRALHLFVFLPSQGLVMLSLATVVTSKSRNPLSSCRSHGLVPFCSGHSLLGCQEGREGKPTGTGIISNFDIESSANQLPSAGIKKARLPRQRAAQRALSERRRSPAYDLME